MTLTEFGRTRLARMLLLGANLVAVTCLPVSAQTNVVSSPPPAGVWDYADQLHFSPDQLETARRLRADLETARTELQQATVTNTPPDAQRFARLHYARQVRAIKLELAGLLTEDQKRQYRELLHPGGPAQTNEAAEKVRPPVDPDEAGPGEISTAKVKIRPLQTDEEYRLQAAQLRAVYAQPASNWPAANVDDEAKPHFAEIGLLPPVKYPTNNPYSDAKAELGKRLYFDPRLSGSGQIACASCHDPDLAWTDGRTVSFGHARKVLKRNAPMILNAGQLVTPFWDGRVNSLEEQARAVLNNEDEMRSGADLVRERLLAIPGYTNRFAEVFGDPEPTIGRTVQAIATFERTINSRANDFDNFLLGDTNALSDAAVRGLNLFRTTARCINCHNGPNFSDAQFHNEGLSYYGRKYEDLGRYVVTHLPADVGRFKTPSLRNVAHTGPYMHNGLFELDGVLAMYNAGMPNLRPTPKQKNDPLFPQKSALLKPLGLNRQDVADLKAFLESLTEKKFTVRPPEFL